MGRFRADVISEHSLQRLFATDLGRSYMTQHWEKRGGGVAKRVPLVIFMALTSQTSLVRALCSSTQNHNILVEKIKGKRPFVYIIPFKRLVQRRLSEHFISYLSSSLMEQDRKDGCCQQQCNLRSASPNQTNLKFWSTEIQHINNLFISITEINFKIVTVVK